jgi:phosphoglycerate dehydrogenase-like enzyme
MPLRVHMSGEPDDNLLGNLRPLLAEVIDLSCGESIPDPADYEILVCGVPDRDAVEASSSLKALIIPWSGLPRKTRELMLQYPQIAVHNIHHNAVPAAEMAITLMLAAAKDLIPIDRSLRQGDWTKRYSPSRATLLAGRRAVVLGYGAIGREIAARCLGFGMTVAAVGAGGETYADTDIEVHSPGDLPTLLSSAGVLFLSLPLTPETEGMIADRELSLLPDDAILVNVSRGAIVDEEALYKHLRSGRLRAGLDVWYEYPKDEGSRTGTRPSAFPFHDLANVVMTPHLAGHSKETEPLRARELARLLNLAAEGKPLPNRVDLEVGY